jgi:hypothetical protein
VSDSTSKETIEQLQTEFRDLKQKAITGICSKGSILIKYDENGETEGFPTLMELPTVFVSGRHDIIYQYAIIGVKSISNEWHSQFQLKLIGVGEDNYEEENTLTSGDFEVSLDLIMDIFEALDCWTVALENTDW